MIWSTFGEKCKWLPYWWRASPGAQLSTALSTACNLGATDPRDYVYSILGLPTARDPHGAFLVEPDYNINFDDLIYKVTRATIERCNTLTMLVLVHHKDEKSLERSPSWVPNVLEQPECLVTNPLIVNGASGERLPSTTFEDKDTLRTNGIEVDYVCHMCKKFTPEDFYLKDDGEGLDAPFTDVLFTVMEYIKSGLAMKGVDDHSDAVSSLITIMCSLAFPKPLQSYDPQDEGSVRTSRWILGLVGCLRHKLFGGGMSDEEKRLSRDSLKNAGMYSIGKRLFITNKGYVGKGDDIVRAGDLVAVLFGARAPYILRPSGAERKYKLAESSIGGIRYEAWRTEPVCKLVGSSYVDGLMKAEAITMAEQGLLQERFFSIC